jgi:hypothetical protein
MDDLAEITAIVRRRHETGDYGSAHLRVTSTLAAEMREQVPSATPRPAWWPAQLGGLLAIPVIVDDDHLPDGTRWALVNYTGEILLPDDLRGSRIDLHLPRSEAG